MIIDPSAGKGFGGCRRPDGSAIVGNFPVGKSDRRKQGGYFSPPVVGGGTLTLLSVNSSIDQLRCEGVWWGEILPSLVLYYLLNGSQP